jgi:hypothetical protein
VTLPVGTSPSTMINEIEASFKSTIFGFYGINVLKNSPPQISQEPQSPTLDPAVITAPPMNSSEPVSQLVEPNTPNTHVNDDHVANN